VEEHGGTIQCESTVGRGTRFTLRFPPAPLETKHEATVTDTAT
jgi:signal transduction histidine kinase